MDDEDRAKTWQRDGWGDRHTDMRATERLLEVIDHSSTEIVSRMPESVREPDEVDFIGIALHLGAIREAVTELRRRGDTLVRRDDLVEAVEHVTDEWVEGGLDGISVWRQAIGRLEAALGGKPW